MKALCFCRKPQANKSRTVLRAQLGLTASIARMGVDVAHPIGNKPKAKGSSLSAHMIAAPRASSFEEGFALLRIRRNTSS